jgi:hypothetical protein
MIARLELADWSPTPDQPPGQSCEGFDLRLTSRYFPFAGMGCKAITIAKSGDKRSDSFDVRSFYFHRNGAREQVNRYHHTVGFLLAN